MAACWHVTASCKASQPTTPAVIVEAVMVRGIEMADVLALIPAAAQQLRLTEGERFGHGQELTARRSVYHVSGAVPMEEHIQRFAAIRRDRPASRTTHRTVPKTIPANDTIRTI